MWARKKGGKGVYILFDGSTPVYIGKGNIRQRVTGARRSQRRGQLWDRFSWYAIKDPKMMHDIEVLVLRLLPRYLRALTRREGHFQKAHSMKQVNKKQTTSPAFHDEGLFCAVGVEAFASFRRPKEVGLIDFPAHKRLALLDNPQSRAVNKLLPLAQSLSQLSNFGHR